MVKKNITAPKLQSNKRTGADVAIIGMACRFPGANDYNEYWDNLIASKNSIREITADRWDIETYYSNDINEPNKSISKWAGLIDDIDKFDASFFNISPREAQVMDPQQRLLLEETWHCIEDAGISLNYLRAGNTSVYVGVMALDYQHIATGIGKTDGYACLGNYEGILANRVSYFFNFQGESKSIDAACASSLVALHDACVSLSSGKSQYAITAGVSIICHPWKYISFSKARMLSPDGQCKTFDAQANGYVPGEGIGVLLLETLENAIKNGHRVYAIIKGSAVHHSGKTQSITAPKVESERDVIKEAIKNSGIDAESITYLEAHGTGTSLGDPIEVEAATQAFNTDKKQYCSIGSVKTNIGHLEAAAGIAGVIKLVLMLQHKKIPKTLNVTNINPIIDFEQTPFRLADELSDWNLPEEIIVRRAGVSSFGFGGVISHAVLEEYIPKGRQKEDLITPAIPFILSAQTQLSLTKLVNVWKKYVESDQFKNESVQNISFTLSRGRENLPYRFGSAINNKKQISEILNYTFNNYNQQTLVNKQFAFHSNPMRNLTYKVFSEFCKQYPILNKSMTEIQSVLSKTKNGESLLNKLNTIDKISKMLKDLLIPLIIFRALNECGVKFNKIIDGGMVGAVLSDMLDLKTAIQLIDGLEPKIILRRPKIDLYNAQSHELIRPFLVTADYCRHLIENIDISDDEKNDLIYKSTELYSNQFTFKKYLNEWEKELKINGIEILPALKQFKSLAETQQTLIIIILLISLKRLKEKWQLGNHIIDEHTELSECVDLVVDKVINQKTLIKLILNKDNSTLEEISQYIQENQSYLDKSKPYTILKQYNQTVTDISDQKSWLLQSFKENLDLKDQDNSINDDDLILDLRPADILEGWSSFLVKLWLKGADINWEHWFSSENCQVVSLPNYQFDKTHYWTTVEVSSNAIAGIHPLLDYNTSTLDVYRFEKELTGNEYYLSEHRVYNIPTVPSVTYLEMAIAAGNYAVPDKKIVGFRNIMWGRPLQFFNTPLKVTLSLHPKQTDLMFQATSLNEANKSGLAPIIHIQGKIIFEKPLNNKMPERLDISAIESRCLTVLNVKNIYSRWSQIGIQCDTSFQVIESIATNNTELIARLKLPTNLLKSASEYTLHPSLMDAALETIYVLEKMQAPTVRYLPFSIDEITIFEHLRSPCYVYAQAVPVDQSPIIEKFNIKIANESGDILVDIKNFTLRLLQSLKQPYNQEIVLPGHKAVIETEITQPSTTTQKPKGKTVPNTEPKSADEILHNNTQNQLIEIIAEILNLPLDKIEITEPLSGYGMDSISITELFIQIDEIYAIELSPAIIFEHQNLKSFANYLVMQYRDKLAKFYQEKLSIEAKVKELDEKKHTESSAAIITPHLESLTTKQNIYEHKELDIAIIGMSGIFPCAKDLSEFWNNLIAGKDAIQEIPKDRWDWQTYYGNTEGKTKVKWGGFIEDIDKFDAAFFNISPREAELMDPQQRLFLETVWHAIEHAGYARSDLVRIKTGLFVGVACHDYTEVLEKAGSHSAYVPTGTMSSVLANRVSFQLDLHGPSVSIDTACSSSLVALDEAVKAIHEGDCEIAIAGGVNALLSPTLFLEFSKAGMLSPDGRCKTFDRSANGYVRGEGVGVIILKPLSKALADNDTIYGVIKGTAVNHGGHVNSLTVPNPHAQAEAITTAIKRANIDINTLSYIEAHGTGTTLGDPIEVNGLKEAFKILGEEQGVTKNFPYCGLGSVKTNIGHLEGAAGIAGVIKVLLALKNQQLPRILHFKELNPYLEIDKSPFYIIENNSPWIRLKNDSGQDIPRRAGVSSFGFGGVNGHVVIEEAPEQVIGSDTTKPYYLLTFSAKEDISLQQKIKDLITWLNSHPDAMLQDISYTLNAGRMHYKKRLAMVVASVQELKEMLQQLMGHKSGTHIYFGSRAKKTLDVKQHEIDSTALLNKLDPSSADYLKILSELAKLYVDNHNIDWELLHRNEAKHRISLPTYPFIKKRYWVNAKDIAHTNLHPLLDTNDSTLDELKFNKILTGNEFYLTDHRVNGVPTFPGVAYIEMARAAAIIISNNSNIKMKLCNITWSRPIQVFDNDILVTINLSHRSPGVKFKITTNDSSGQHPVTHCQGKIIPSSQENIAMQPPLDIAGIKGRCQKKQGNKDIYEHFKTVGLGYGPFFQAIHDIMSNESEALSRMLLPSNLKDDASRFVLHPSILDGALQTCFCLLKNKEILYLPFSLGQVDIFGPVPATSFAHAVIKPGSEVLKTPSFDIQVTDESGRLIVQLHDFSMRQVEIKKEKSASNIYYYQPAWEQSPIPKASNGTNLCGPVLIVDEASDLVESFRSRFHQQVVVWIRPGESYQQLNDTDYLINKMRLDDYTLILKNLTEHNLLPKYIIYRSDLDKPAGITESIIPDQSRINYYPVFYLSQAIIRQKHHEQIQFLYIGGNNTLITESLAGFMKTARLENPNLNCRCIGFQSLGYGHEIILNELYATEVEVRYDKDQMRWTKIYQEVPQSETLRSSSLLKKKGVYLITGGAGGLGLIFARYLAENYNARLILTGRSELTETTKSTLIQLEHLGAKVIYSRTDVTNQKDLVKLIHDMQERFGVINGVIHSAGVIHDSFISKKTQHEIESVLAPKVNGTVNLDEATQFMPLDFFVMFSSMVSILGNIGQCDYAYGNAFMDAFISFREQLRLNNKRRGKTISINWPLWAKGGMKINEASLKLLEKTMGIVPLSTIDGINAFLDALNHASSQLIVLPGNRQKIEKSLGLIKSTPEKPTTHIVKSASTQTTNEDVDIVSQTSNIGKDSLLEKVQAQLLEMVAAVLNTEKEILNPEEELSEYGMDSVSQTDLTMKLDDYYGLELSPATLFEHRTLKSYANYLVTTYRPIIAAHYESKTVNIADEPTSGIGKSISGIDDNALLEKVQAQVLEMVAAVLNTEKEILNPEEELSEYGMDSVSQTELTMKLDDYYGLELSPATLFEHRTLKSYANYLVTTYRPIIAAHYERKTVNITDEPTSGISKSTSGIDDNALLEKVQAKVLEMVAAVLNTEKEILNPEEELSEYGMDSVSQTELTMKLDDYYGLELSPATLFEHRTLKSYANYLVTTYRPVFEKYYSNNHVK